MDEEGQEKQAKTEETGEDEPASADLEEAVGSDKDEKEDANKAEVDGVYKAKSNKKNLEFAEVIGVDGQASGAAVVLPDSSHQGPDVLEVLDQPGLFPQEPLATARDGLALAGQLVHPGRLKQLMQLELEEAREAGRDGVDQDVALAVVGPFQLFQPCMGGVAGGVANLVEEDVLELAGALIGAG